MRLAAVVIDWMPEAQLWCTVWLTMSWASPALRLITRAMLAACAGWATLPKMTSDTRSGAMPVRASNSLTTSAPRSSAAMLCIGPPALQNGVRTPSSMAIRGLSIALTTPEIIYAIHPLRIPSDAPNSNSPIDLES